MGLIYQNEILYSGSGGGGTGDVADVYVNGQSVLDSNKIAQIKSYKEVTQAEYDALPASKESDDVLYCITDKATADTTVAPIIYSENEREVGVWTDGKPLYQTTIHTGALTKDGNWHSIVHNISNIDKIILCTGIVYAADNTAYFMPNYRPGLTQGICLDATTTDIEYIQNWLDTSPDSYVTLQYTKTTDQPGSGKYAPSGVPAVHYSENEQIVGTWTDGSALYERSYTIPQTSSDYTIFDFTGLNINEAINVYAHEGTAFAPSTSETPYGSAPLSGYTQSYAGDLGFVGYVTHDANTGVYQLHYRVGSYLSGGTARVTVRYNKITS